MMRGLKAVGAVGVTMAMAACAAPAGEPARWPITASRSHAQCPLAEGEGASARLFDSAAQWPQKAILSSDRAAGSTVDWSREQLLVVSLGQKSTLGHQIAAAADSLSLEARSARLQVKVTQPAPGDMVAQALSRPCVVLRVGRRQWQDLTVVDQNGATVWKGPLSASR